MLDVGVMFFMPTYCMKIDEGISYKYLLKKCACTWLDFEVQSPWDVNKFLQKLEKWQVTIVWLDTSHKRREKSKLRYGIYELNGDLLYPNYFKWNGHTIPTGATDAHCKHMLR